MMEAGEKIYLAKERWNCSFEELSFLLEMDRNLVMELYHQERALRSPNITLDGDTSCLGLSERTKNCLKRIGVRTVKDLLTCTRDFSAIRGCGKLSVQEIQDGIQAALSVLKFTAADLMQLFASPGVSVELTWVNGEVNDYHSVVTNYEITSASVNEVFSITGRSKGWVKTIRISIWVSRAK